VGIVDSDLFGFTMAQVGEEMDEKLIICDHLHEREEEEDYD
jgi:hypothetical protein